LKKFYNAPNVNYPMERVGTLINKLQEQFANGQSAQHLMHTTQMLLAELQQQATNQPVGKVAVTMPFTINNAPVQAEETTPIATAQPISSFSSTIHSVEEVVAEPISTVVEPIVQAAPIEAPITRAPTQAVEEPAVTNNVTTSWLFDPISTTIPTLAHHEELSKQENSLNNPTKEVFELKDVLALEEEKENLNDKLKENKTEVVALLQGTPVKDLRKAIGINDRYLFINELFRGDENMYERSIKTINSFNIYPEAEYWIQRELKVKLGWLEEAETVKVFDQLVKRRFS
jgi:hypothetical protein